MRFKMEIESSDEQVLELFQAFTALLFKEGFKYMKSVEIEVAENVDCQEVCKENDCCPF